MMQKFNGTSWVIVGNPTVSDSGWGEEKGYPTLRYNPSGTTPYVAYVDGDGDGPLVVRKFNGTSWETVGNAGFTPDNGHSPSIAFGPDGLPYVAYITNGGAPGVMRFNGTSWHDVGEQFFDSEVASEGLSLVVDSSGTPYLAYIGYGDAKLVKFDQDSGSWVSASGEYSLVYGSSYSISSSASMDSDGNIYFFIADDTNYRVFKVSDSG